MTQSTMDDCPRSAWRVIRLWRRPGDLRLGSPLAILSVSTNTTKPLRRAWQRRLAELGDRGWSTRDACFEFLPVRHGGVGEERLHGAGSASCRARREGRVDGDDRIYHFVQDPLTPQWPVQAGLGETEEGVGQCDGYQDAGVQERAVAGTGQLARRLRAVRRAAL